MPQIKVTYIDFNLASDYSCKMVDKLYYHSQEGTPFKVESNVSSSTTTPGRAVLTPRFSYELPSGIKITSAKVYATLSKATWGCNVSTINGVDVGHNATVSVDVNVTIGSSYVDVPFVFRSYNPKHNPLDRTTASKSESWQIDAYKTSDGDTVDIKTVTYTENHRGIIRYSDVYLLIEYEDPIDATLQVTETADKTGTRVGWGEKITYTVKVTNKGNVPFTNVKVTDALTGKSWTISSLAVGASETYTTTYTVTSADILAGKVTSSATAKGDSIPDHDTSNPAHVPQGSSSTVTVTTVAINVTLQVAITSDKAGAKITIGDTITYTIEVANIGNVPLTNVKVVDTLTGRSWTIAELAVNALKVYTTTYTIVYTDTKQGSVANTVTAIGDTIGGFTPEDTSSVSNAVAKVGFLLHAEGGRLIPYLFYRAESGRLVPYLLKCTLEPTDASMFITADGEVFRTADGDNYRVLKGG